MMEQQDNERTALAELVRQLAATEPMARRLCQELGIFLHETASGTWLGPASAAKLSKAVRSGNDQVPLQRYAQALGCEPAGG